MNTTLLIEMALKFGIETALELAAAHETNNLEAAIVALTKAKNKSLADYKREDAAVSRGPSVP